MSDIRPVLRAAYLIASIALIAVAGALGDFSTSPAASVAEIAAGR